MARGQLRHPTVARWIEREPDWGSGGRQALGKFLDRVYPFKESCRAFISRALETHIVSLVFWQIVQIYLPGCE